MATKKKATKTSSGTTPKSKRVVKDKVGKTMHEMKQGELKSGRSSKKVKNPKQAIAIGLSEARRAGADVPPAPAKKGAKKAVKKATKKTATKKTATKKTATKKSPAKKTAAKKTASKKTTAKKS